MHVLDLDVALGRREVQRSPRAPRRGRIWNSAMFASINASSSRKRSRTPRRSCRPSTPRLRRDNRRERVNRLELRLHELDHVPPERGMIEKRPRYALYPHEYQPPNTSSSTGASEQLRACGRLGHMSWRGARPFRMSAAPAITVVATAPWSYRRSRLQHVSCLSFCSTLSGSGSCETTQQIAAALIHDAGKFCWTLVLSSETP